jgi:murein DD-endopeptidase MepM/ murein hydrolase activator NlpD
MRARRQRGGWLIPAFALVFYAGLAAGWWLHGRGIPDERAAEPHAVDLPVPTRGDAVAPTAGVSDPAEAASRPGQAGTSGTTPGSLAPGGDRRARLLPDAIAELKGRRLRMPVEGARIEWMKGSFAERRGGGARAHEAADILAPRHRPVQAVEGGTIARLSTSAAGGLMIHQFDPVSRFCYYYPHLDRYAAGLHEGQGVAAGEIIGYVRTSGNAPPGAPHLHFAIFELAPDRRWWKGTPLDPYDVYLDLRLTGRRKDEICVDPRAFIDPRAEYLAVLLSRRRCSGKRRTTAKF